MSIITFDLCNNLSLPIYNYQNKYSINIYLQKLFYILINKIIKEYFTEFI